MFAAFSSTRTVGLMVLEYGAIQPTARLNSHRPSRDPPSFRHFAIIGLFLDAMGSSLRRVYRIDQTAFFGRRLAPFPAHS